MIPQKCLRYAYPIIVLCRYCSRLQYRLFGGVQPNTTATSAARNIMLRSTQLRCPSGFCSTRRSVTSLGVGARSCVATRAVKQNSNRQATTKPPPAPASSTDGQRGFLLASERLEQLLEEGSLSNKDTVPIDHLDALSAEERLTLFTNLGTLMLLGEILVCWLFGQMDPLGGMDFNMQSAHAALWGAAFSTPLVLCSIAARSELFKQAFPVMDQLHDQQAALQKRILAGMNATQVGIWLSFITIPGLLALLPATRAGVLWSLSFAQQALLQTWGSGVTFPTLHLGLVAFLATPLVSCYLAGMAAAGCLGVRPKHIELLRDAVRNADAYFRLAVVRQPQGQRPGPSGSSYRAAEAAGRGGAAVLPQYGASVFASSSSLTLEQDLSESESDEGGYEALGSAGTAQVAADAFKTLAMVWLLSRKRVAHLACVLTGLNVMYYSVLWATTGDMAAPIAAALLHAGAECWFGARDSSSSGRG